MAISKKSWLGVAREATSGTAITTPTLYVPTKSMIKGKKKQEFLDEERGDRNGEYDVVEGIRWSEWDAKGPFYPDAHVYFLLAAMGGLTTSQPNAVAASTVYKHTLALADVPPSLTLMKSFDAKTYYTPYSVVEKFSIKFTGDGKILTLDANGKALWPVIQVSPPTPSFTAVKPFSGYAPTVKLFNTASTDIDEVTINYEQKITLWNPADGNPDWITAYFGERKISLDFTARFDNDTLYQRYQNNQYDMFSFDVLGAQLANLTVVTLGAPSAGNFTLTYGGQTTGNIAFNAAASVVQTALVGLSSIGTGNATVTGSAGGPYTINLNASLGSTNLITGSGAGLTGGTFSVGPQTLYNYEFNLGIPVIYYADMEHDLGKDNVLVKAKAKGLATSQTINGQSQVGTGNNLFNAYVMNTVSSYTV